METETQGAQLFRIGGRLPIAEKEAFISEVLAGTDDTESLILEAVMEPNNCALPGYVTRRKGEDPLGARYVEVKVDGDRTFYTNPDRASKEAEQDMEAVCENCILSVLARQTGKILCRPEATRLTVKQNPNRYAPAVHRNLLP